MTSLPDGKLKFYVQPVMAEMAIDGFSGASRVEFEISRRLTYFQSLLLFCFVGALSRQENDINF